MRPDISVIMPVCAWPDPSDMAGQPHPDLTRALDSIIEASRPREGFRTPRVELIVGVDGDAWQVGKAIGDWAISSSSDLNVLVRYFEKSQHECTWGNRQRNRILDSGLALGQLIVWQDQDDSFYPDALSNVLAVADAHPGRPLVFRMTLQHWDPPGVLWTEKGVVEHCKIGGHMLVTPNEPATLARWEPEDWHDADFPFIKKTLENFAKDGREAFWSEEFISMQRQPADDLTL